NVTAYLGGHPTDPTAGYTNVIQVRLSDISDTGGSSPSYWSTDILVNPTGGTWSVLYPSISVTSTTTSLSANPPGPQTAPAAAITLKATVTDNAPGTVTFTDTDTSTQVGTTQTLPATGGGNNFVTVTIPAGLAVGTHHYSASYTPSSST